MECPDCGKQLYKAFTLAGDIGWCINCNYKTAPKAKVRNFIN